MSPNFQQGLSIFIVATPIRTSAGTWNILQFHQGTGSANAVAIHQTASTQWQIYITNGGTNTSLVSSGLSTSTAQLYEAADDGNTSCTLYVNGTQKATSASQEKPPNVLFDHNQVGANGLSGNLFKGNIAEILVYNTLLTGTDRQAVENYLMSKYGLANGGGGGTPTLAAPTISPQYAISSTPQTVTMTGPAGATIFYQINNGQPTPYTGPFTISAAGTSNISATSQAPGYQTSQSTTGTIAIDQSVPAVMQSGLQLWLRSDVGAVNSGPGTAVTAWYDMSGNNNTATPANSPTLSTINSVAAVNFNGTNQYFSLPATSAYTAGCSIFVVAEPAGTITNLKRFVDFGSGTTTNSFLLDEYAGSQAALINDHGGTETGARATISSGVAQVIDAVYNGTNTATVYVNGVSGTPNTSMNAMVNTNRTTNSIGRYGGGGNYFNGQIAEVIMFNTALSDAQRQAVESYLEARYAILVNPPTITPTGVYATAVQTLSMSADPGATIYYTLDGSAPSTSSPKYDPSNPPEITSSTVVNAYAVQPFGHSTVVTSYVAMDQLSGLVSRNGLVGWYFASFGASVSGSNFTWTDLSGNNNTATASGSTAPSITANALNGYSAVVSTSSQYASLPSGYANLDGGVSIFDVGGSSPNNLGFHVNLGNGSASDNVQLSGGPPVLFSFNIYQGSTEDSLHATLPTSTQNYHIYGALNTGSVNKVGYMYYDGFNFLSATQNNPLNITRSTNTIANGGEYPEIFIYDRPLTGTEISLLQLYLSRKYALPLKPAAPVFSVASGTAFSSPSQVAISGPPNSIIYVTTDNTTPSPTNYTFIYSAPFTINCSTPYPIQAAAAVNGIVGATSSASYTLSPPQYPAPSGGSSGPQLNLQVPTPAQ